MSAIINSGCLSLKTNWTASQSVEVEANPFPADRVEEEAVEAEAEAEVYLPLSSLSKMINDELAKCLGNYKQ